MDISRAKYTRYSIFPQNNFEFFLYFALDFYFFWCLEQDKKTPFPAVRKGRPFDNKEVVPDLREKSLFHT
jgi:hypothetical protein